MLVERVQIAKGWYIPKKRGGKIAHFINSKGRSRCGGVKVEEGKYRSDSESFGKGTYRCQKCLSWLKAYGEDDDRE